MYKSRKCLYYRKSGKTKILNVIGFYEKEFKCMETDETCQKPTPTFRKIVFQVRLRRHFTIVRGDNGIIDQ